MPAQITEAFLKPAGYRQITSLSSAAGISNIPDNARVALISAEAQAVRWRDDGTNPTASVGMVIAAGADMVYTGDFSAIKFIEVSVSAKVNVSFYK